MYMVNNLLLLECNRDPKIYDDTCTVLKETFNILIHKINKCYTVNDVKKEVQLMREKVFSYLIYDNHPYMKLCTNINEAQDTQFTGHFIELIVELKTFDIDWFLHNDG